MEILFDRITAMESMLTFHRDRQTVLAGNLANLDTPGYVPVDLATNARTRTEGGSIAKTDDQHLDPTGATPQSTETIEDTSVEARKDGNQVSLERELAKIDANRIRYVATTELVSRRLAMLRYTAGDGT